MLKRTPLFEQHQKLGGRLVEFGGWEMPVQYTSIMDEHQVVRRAGGIFDISHMGEALVSGAGAATFLNRVLTNDITRLVAGQGQYTLMCNERGGVIDDLYVYRLSADEYLLIINASRIDADIAWLQKQLASLCKFDPIKLQNISDQTGAVAVQGPRVAEFIDYCFPGASCGGTIVHGVTELKKNQIARFELGGKPIWISRTGYTGEDGFEIVSPAEMIGGIWSQVLAFGHPYCLQPAGLGARDTLRTEVCYPLYGNELDEQTTPIEAGLGFFVGLDKGDFIGRAVLLEQRSRGAAKKCVAFKMTDKSAPPRAHYPVWSAGPNAQPLGVVTRGTQSPSLGIGVGMGYVKPEFAKADTPIEIEIRGRRAAAVVVPKPIYRKPVDQTPAP